MYLIFQGVGECCKIPGKACGACADLCKQMNCNACTQCCRSISSNCKGFVERPLSSFVVITIIMSIVELGYLGSTFGMDALKSCKLPDDAFVSVTGWIVGQMAFALLNLLFAPYFQKKVWEKIYQEAEAEEKLKTQAEVPVEKEVVQGAFKEVFMKDLGVCFYFFALIASFAWSSEGFQWVTQGSKECNPDNGLSLSANVGWAFFFVAVFYTLAWYCCSCCAKATVIRGGYDDPAMDDESGANKPLQE